jgi:hypothetical protein
MRKRALDVRLNSSERAPRLSRLSDRWHGDLVLIQQKASIPAVFAMLDPPTQVQMPVATLNFQ